MRPALSDQLSDRFVFEERCKIDEDVIVIEHSSRELIFGECGLDCSDLVFEIEIVRAFAFDCLADRKTCVGCKTDEIGSASCRERVCQNVSIPVVTVK